MSIGDRAVGSTLDFAFNTEDQSGAPITLAGTPSLAVYKGNGTTESTAGVTLDVDHDGKAGSHHVRIDTGADGTFYAGGNDFRVQVAAGTVNGISAVGKVVGHFSLGKSAAYDRLGAPAGASIAADIAGVQGDTDNIQTRLPAALTGAGNMKTDVLAIEGADPTDTIRDSVVSDATRFAGADVPAIKGFVDDLEGRLTNARAGYLDNLNVGGNIASSAEVTAIQNNTRVVRVVPGVFERPDSGSTVFRVELLIYDTQGAMEAPDSAPTLSVVNQAGTSRDGNLDSTTMSLVSTGRYRSTYTIDTAHALEELIFAFSVVEGSATRIYANPAQVVDTTAVDFTAADRTKLDAINAKLPSKSYLAGTNNSDGDVQADEMTGNFPGSVASVAGAVGSVSGNVGGNVAGSVGSLATQAKADVNAEADAALLDVGLTSAVTGRVDAAVSTRATPAQVKTQADQALVDVGLTGTITSRIDAAISSRLAAAGYTAPDNATIAAIAVAVITELAEVLADTNELQTDWANGGRLDLLIDAIKAKVDPLPAAPAATGDIPSAAQVATAVRTGVLTEGYAALGAAPTFEQAMMMTLQLLAERSILGTTLTVKKLDGSTEAMTFDLDDADAPTSQTRAS